MASPKSKTAKPAKVIDWEGMQPHWQAGILSVAELSRRYGVSRPGIEKHWEKLGIERNLTSQIQDQAAALVQRAEASGTPPVAPEPAAGDRHQTSTETIEFNAVMQATVILRQRKDVKRAQDIAGELLTELESQTFDRTLYQRLDEVLRAAGKAGKVNAKALAELQGLYARVVSHSGRIENFRKLTETMKVLTELERKVLAIADDTPVDPAKRVEQAIENGMDELRRRFAAKGVKV